MGIRQRFDVYSIPIKHPDLTFSEETRDPSGQGSQTRRSSPPEVARSQRLW